MDWGIYITWNNPPKKEGERGWELYVRVNDYHVFIFGGSRQVRHRHIK